MCELQIKSILRIAPYILSIVLILLRLSSVRFSFSSTSTLNISRVLQTPFICPELVESGIIPFITSFASSESSPDPLFDLRAHLEICF